MAQCPPGTVPSGTNLVVNGNFSSGNTGFNSSYVYGTGGNYGLVSNAGQYAIVTSPNAAHVNFAAFGDHTTGSGNFMVVNGSGIANMNVWCQNVAVQPNTIYTFSTWIASVDSDNPAVLQFSINGTNLGSPFAVSPNTGLWQQFFTTWYSGLNTSANICIVNQNTSTIGNDFAIDDISFVECECNLNVNAGPDTTVCEGSSVQLYATGGDSYQWYPLGGLTNSGIANPVATATNNITYYAIVSNAVGCIDTASATINVIPQQQISAGVDDSICFGDSIQLNAVGSGTISWFPTTGLSNPNILNPIAYPTQTTDYVLTITDGPCVYYDTVTIFVKQLPQLDAGVNDSVCAGSSIQLNGSGSGIASWFPSTGLNNSNILNPVASPIQTTKYNLTIQSNGCVNTDSVTIVVKPLPQINAGSDKEICEGSSVQLNGSGNGIATWSPSAGLSNPNILNPVASPLQTTSYILNISSIGCENTDTVVVSVKQLPQVNAGANDSICAEESIQLNGSGSGTVLWNPSSTLNNGSILNPVATPTQTTSYILQIDSAGCSITDTVLIVVKSLPLVSAGLDDTICAGESIQLNGNGNGSASWFPLTGLNNSSILNPVATLLQTTKYYLTVQSNGCQNTDSVTITVKSLPQVNAGIDEVICESTSVLLNGSGNGIVTWFPSTGLNNPNVLNPVASPSQTTNYILIVVANGCENTDTVVVSVKPLPQISAGANDSICLGESIQLNGSGSGTVLWNSSSTLNNNSILNPVATPTQTTSYILQIDSAGCANTDTVLIVVKSLPLVSAGVDDTICAGESIQLNGNGTGNVSWLPAQTLSNDLIINPVATPGQSTIYVLTIEENGCYNKDSVTIYVTQLPQVNAGTDQSICEGSSIQLSGTGTGTVSWSPGSGMNNSTIHNPVISPLQTTVYAFTVSSNGCENSDSVLITVIPLPQVNAGVDDTICAGESIQLNGSGTGNVLWSPALTLNNNLILNPVAMPNQTTVYVLTIEENGCTNNDSVTIFVKQLPQVNAGTDQSICEGFSTQLNGTGNGIVSWFPDSGMNNSAIINPVVSPYQTTIYTLSIFSNGCENSDSVKITVIPLPDVQAGDDKIVCFGESIQLSATGASNYSWSPAVYLNDENTANPVSLPLQTTEYTVTGILNGCTNYDTIKVVVAPLPVINAGNDTIVPKETNYMLTGFPAGGSWSSDDGMLCSSCTNYNMVITRDQPFYYHYIDSNGCENRDTVFIYLNRICKDPYFPTAFSPNDDLLNDAFLPVFEDIHVVLEVEFIIYNKWGEQVFYTNKINEGWDGKTKNFPQMIGVYAYLYKYGCETDSKVIKGSFTLVR